MKYYSLCECEMLSHDLFHFMFCISKTFHVALETFHSFGGEIMKENKLADLSMEFSVQVIHLCENIKGHRALVDQLERAATSVGANIR